MLIRLALILAILAGLAVGGLNFTKVKEKITTLQKERDFEKDEKVKAQTELTSTKKDLAKTKTELTQTKTALDTATADLASAKSNLEKTSTDLDSIKKQLEKTADELKATQQELSAYKATGVTPEQILAFTKEHKKVQDALAVSLDENRLLARKNRNLQNELDIYVKQDYAVPLPAKLTGKVLVTDPKWNFVILNVGENQGVLNHAELLVNRNGSLVAKVRVTSVQKDRCVANVLPEWKLGDVFEGDHVIPANPASSSALCLPDFVPDGSCC